MRMFLSMLLAGAAGWPGFAPAGRWAQPTPQLAAELLSPEQAADAVEHGFGLPIFQGGMPSSLRFIGKPRSTVDGFCVRRMYHVSIYARPNGIHEPQPPIEGMQLRQGACDGIFAHLNPGASVADGKKVMTWIDWAKGVARSSSPLPFTLNCQSETSQDKCSKGARAALAALPLDKTTVITRDFHRRNHRWDVLVTETRPGQLYWEVVIDASPARPSIDMTWKIPAPF